MSKCISSHGEYSEHEPGDPCPWCGEYDTARIIAVRDEALARIQAVRDVLDADTKVTEHMGTLGTWQPQVPAVSADSIRRALNGDA